MNSARLISFCTGFFSLSLEIVWIRLYGYAHQSTPQAFSYVLAIYLLGIAFGAQVGKWVCQESEQSKIENASVIALAAGAVVSVLAPWSFLLSKEYALDHLIAPFGIFSTAAFLSVLFPITHHLGTLHYIKSVGESKKGKDFSRVYLMNVLGAAMGPIVTGYLLLEYLTITQTFAVLAGGVACLALVVWVFYEFRRKKHNLSVFLVSIFCLIPVVLFADKAWSDPHLFARSFSITSGLEVVDVHENRHGIISIAESPKTSRQPFVDHAVYGGNVYDGKVNVDLGRNTNGLERLLVMHALQPEAKRVLVVGLSIGSWLSVIAGFPGVEEIDVIEINSGYLDLAEKFEPQRRAINNGRVRVIVDDARRWLSYQRKMDYDLIVMNTTWHWRANSSMLLSWEMMQLVNSHLSERGVIAFNATGSVDAFYTASKVFGEVRRYQNFVYGANWDPFSKMNDPQEWEKLKNVSIDGGVGFKGGDFNLNKYRKIPFLKIQDDLNDSKRMPEIIRDDNMIVEYKYGKK